MKTILFVSDANSIHTRRWAEHFSGMGIDVHVASFRDDVIPGVTVHVLGTHGFGKAGYLWAVPALRRLAARLKPDVVHAQYVTSYGFLAALAGLHPLVVTAWGTDVLISPKVSRIRRWLASYAVQRADAVTTVAAHMNAAVAELGVPLERVTAVPFGVDTERFVPAVPPPSPDGPLRIICTRNFAPVYDVRTLVDAVRILVASGRPLTLDLIGAGPLRDELVSQVQTDGLSEVTTFHGHVTHASLSGLLARSHVFVSPALSDGNNVSLNEAMACGCFPIATNIPANAQWIRDGSNGLLYPPGDAVALAACLARAADDPDWRLRVAPLNRDMTIQRAAWQTGVEKMVEVYAVARHRRKDAA